MSFLSGALARITGAGDSSSGSEEINNSEGELVPGEVQEMAAPQDQVVGGGLGNPALDNQADNAAAGAGNAAQPPAPDNAKRLEDLKKSRKTLKMQFTKSYNKCYLGIDNKIDRSKLVEYYNDANAKLNSLLLSHIEYLSLKKKLGVPLEGTDDTYTGELSKSLAILKSGVYPDSEEGEDLDEGAEAVTPGPSTRSGRPKKKSSLKVRRGISFESTGSSGRDSSPVLLGVKTSRSLDRSNKFTHISRKWMPAEATVNAGDPLMQAVLGNLPTSDLVKPFRGDAKDWPEFETNWTDCDNRLAMMGKNYFFRLTALKNKLQDEPARLVASLPPINDSYVVALNLLKHTYDDKTIVIRQLHRDLNNLPLMEADVRMFYTRVVSLHQTIVALNFRDNEFSQSFLIDSVVKKLTVPAQREWAKLTLKHRDTTMVLGHKLTFSDLLKIIEVQVQVITLLKREAKGDSSSKRPSHGKFNKKGKTLKKLFNAIKAEKQVEVGTSNLKALSVQLTEVEKADKKAKNICPICTLKGHYPMECVKVKRMSQPDLIKLVKDKKLCRICLNPGHGSSSCRLVKLYKCKKCGKDSHNSLLHFELRERDPKKKVEVRAILQCPLGEQQKLIANAQIHGKEGCQKKEIYPMLEVLACWLTTFPDSKGRKSDFCVSLLLDSGSEATLISKELVEHIGAQKLKAVPEILGIKTINGEMQTEDTAKVCFQLQDWDEKNEPMEIEAYVYDGDFTPKNYAPKGLDPKYASYWDSRMPYNFSTKKGMRVEILLGQPYYTLIEKKLKEKSPWGLPYLMDSKLGPFLAGGWPLHRKK